MKNKFVMKAYYPRKVQNSCAIKIDLFNCNIGLHEKLLYKYINAINFITTKLAM